MITWEQILIRLVTAAFLGALIGIERETRKWAAGLRTHMMVCVGSCLIMIVSAYGFFDVLGNKNVELDPSRVAAQVVSGIGFIGAGVILFQHRGTVRGLTTAAGLWTVAAIGLAAGGGLFFAAVATTVVALIILWALRPVEKLYFRRYGSTTLRVVTEADTSHITLIQDLIFKDYLKIQSFKLEKKPGKFTFYINFEKTKGFQPAAILKELQDNKEVKEVYWTK